MPNSEYDQLAVEVAREQIAHLAPQELPLFRPLSAAYLKDPDNALRRRSGRDEMLGLGPDVAAVFVTPVVLAVSQGVLQFLAEDIKKSYGVEGSAPVTAILRKLFRRPGPDNSDNTTPRLSPAQLQQVHQLALEKARLLDLPEPQARLLAESLTGGLAVSP